MKAKKLIIFLILVITAAGSYAQSDGRNDSEQYDGFKYVAMARQLAMLGYEDQDPLFLITAAQTLLDYPVKGNITPDSIEMIEAGISPLKAGGKIIELNPAILLDDARIMAAGDSVIETMIDRIRTKLSNGSVKPRGRKFSPLIQEYLLNADGQVKLWATFNGKEIAEVFVTGNGNTQIDLCLYDKNNRLIDSDLKRTGDCYVSFTPSATTQFRIEIRNNGKVRNQCLLMTN
jgi:hypothetical protein